MTHFEGAEIVEIAARAIQRQHFNGDDAKADEVWCADFEEDAYKDAYRKDARAVLDALEKHGFALVKGLEQPAAN